MVSLNTTHYLPLNQFHLTRPEEVRWLADVTQPDVFTLIKSKSLRKFLKKSEEILQEHHIEWEFRVLTQQDFEEWLVFYRAKMSELNFKLHADTAWYLDRTAKGKAVEAAFFYQEIEGKKTLVGSGIFLINPEKEAVFAFKASEHISLSNEKNSSLGAVIDFLFLKEMFSRKFPIISSGRSGNAYGVTSTFGYPIYKLRLGYEPSTPEDTPFYNWAPVNDEQTTMFYAENANYELGLYFFHPPGVTLQMEHEKYVSPAHPLYTIEYDPSILKTSIEQ
jgi:hypothetical protein